MDWTRERALECSSRKWRLYENLCARVFVYSLFGIFLIYRIAMRRRREREGGRKRLGVGRKTERVWGTPRVEEHPS